ncbi:putative outermembrane protein [hydrothermal vent metagenome]|uniref:Putative outermembrane protein n=1 Tax=hydrothermal vent metagenome TaxID=652676 RepID=A0A3B0X5J2_9ZZZZ
MTPTNTLWLVATKIFILLCIFSPGAHSARAQPHLPSHLIDQANAQKLWENSEWLNLLHYAPKSSNEYTSNVIDARFFIAEDGKENPKTELIATLNALYSRDISNPDHHAQCRFIARFTWLKEQLPEHLLQLPEVSCPLYTEWRKLMPAHKVSLIFPAYHLNSPSSMFGHTLLRIDPAESKNSSQWLSMAVNFGANINDKDNSILYAFKGLSGGYPGIFIVTPYFNKIKEYNRHENRDIWEYPLNLTPDETRKLVLHLWELKEINFKYYFFDENCSYRLLELLEVARPGLQLTDEFGLTAIPVDTVRSIENAALINGIRYRPSQSTNVNFLIRELNSEQQDLTYQLAQTPDLVNSDAFKRLDSSTQNIMLDAAYRYLRVIQNDSTRSELIAKNSYLLLQTINSTANFSSASASYKESQRPEKGHFSKRIAFSIGEDNEEDFAELKFRMSFHSLEDRISGFLPGAQINIASISLRAFDNTVQLQTLDLVDIFSLTPRNQFFQPLSWRISSGLKQQLINGRDHLTGYVTGGAGFSYETWPDGNFYIMATGRLEANSQFTRIIEPALGASTGLLNHFSFGTAHLEINTEEFLNREYRHRAKISQNFTLKRNHALKLSILRQHQPDIRFTEAQISYHYFFQ